MNGGEQTVPPDWTPSTTTKGNDDVDGDDDVDCEEDVICGSNDGTKYDPEDCSKYYMCTCGTNGEWNKVHEKCSDSLLFNRQYLYCDWPENVDCDNKVRNTYNQNSVGRNLGISFVILLLYTLALHSTFLRSIFYISFFIHSTFHFYEKLHQE